MAVRGDGAGLGRWRGESHEGRHLLDIHDLLSLTYDIASGLALGMGIEL